MGNPAAYRGEEVTLVIVVAVWVVDLVLLGLASRPASEPAAVFRGTHPKRGDTAEIHVYLSEPYVTLKLYINGKLVDETQRRADPKYNDRAYPTIGGGFGFAQEVVVDFRSGRITLLKGTAGRNWERIL